MPRTPRRFPRPLLVALVLAGVAAAVARWMAADTAGPAAAMARANRDLKVAGSAAGRVLVSAWNGSEQLFMREADAGPYRALLVPCASVVANLPAWFRLTDDAVLTSCLEIRGESGTVQVLNFRTAVAIPALWDAFYEPLASAAHLDYVGGSASGPGGETRQAPRSLGYTVDGPDGVNNTLSIDAFNWDGRILAVITLRRGRP
jgi:hypothetical protein